MKAIICLVLYIVALSQVVNCGLFASLNKHRDYLTNSISTDDDDIEKSAEIPTQPRSEMLVGAPRLIDPKDRYVNDLLDIHLGRLITGDKNKIIIDQIEEITSQVVAGYLFKVKGHYVVEGEKKNCCVTILSQPWNNGEKVVISAKCDDGSCYVTERYTCSPDSLYATHYPRQNRLLMFA